MPILCACPSCSTRLNLPDNLLGAQVRCPKCGTTFLGQQAAPPDAFTKAPQPAAGVPMWSDMTRPDRDLANRPDTLPGRAKVLIVTILLSVSIFMDVIAIYAGMAQHDLLSRIESQAQVGRDEAERNDAFVGCVGLTQLALSLGTVIAFCFWIYSAHANLRWFGVTRLEYTPGWAVGWFFVPIMNLFRPCQATFEIWKASDPTIRGDSSTAWRAAPGSPLIGFWWASWLLAGVIGNISFQMSMRPRANPSITELKSMTMGMVWNDAFGIFAAVLAIAVVQAIWNRQSRKFQGQDMQVF